MNLSKANLKLLSHIAMRFVPFSYTRGVLFDQFQKQNLISSYQVPTVFDYVQQTAKTQQLEHDIKEWSRKVQIIEQENLMLKKQFSRLQ